MGRPGVVHAEEDPKRLAQQLTNPIAQLESITFEYDRSTADGTLTARTLLPIALDDHWYLVARADLPVVRRGVDTSSASLYVASSDLAWRGVLLGVGPTVSFPASDADLDERTPAIGATAALLYERGSATYGVRADHVWSLGGTRSELELEPQLAWGSDDTGALVNVSCEMSFDVVDAAWSVVAIPEVGRVFELGGVGIAVSAGPLVPVEDADWGFRTSIALAP